MLGQLEMVDIGHSAFDERYINLFRKGFYIGYRAIDQICDLEEIEQPLIQVKQAHMAPRTAAEPRRCQPDLTVFLFLIHRVCPFPHNLPAYAQGLPLPLFVPSAIQNPGQEGVALFHLADRRTFGN